MEVQFCLGHLYPPGLFEQGEVVVGGGEKEGEMAVHEVSVALQLVVEMRGQDLTGQDLHEIAQEPAMEL